MLYNILTAASKTREVGLPEATLYAALGFAIVFVGIAFLILVVWLVGKIMQPRKKAVTTKDVQPIVEPIKRVESITEEIPEETVAVIMAALMAYYQQTNPKCEFTVKRIKRI